MYHLTEYGQCFQRFDFFLYTVAVPTIGGEECENLVDCELYDYDYICIGKFKPWAEVNCPRYCGFCPGMFIGQIYILCLLVTSSDKLFKETE